MAEKLDTTYGKKSTKIFWKSFAMLKTVLFYTPACCFANDYTWPPRENTPALTMVGPVYETALELQSDLPKILADSLKKLANSPECCLPESYVDALGDTQYLRFVSGYSHDEEWDSIKSTAFQIDGTAVMVLVIKMSSQLF